MTSELVEKYRLRRFGAPEFPTQNAEGKPGGGYDVKLPAIPIFLQFKRSDCLTTANAKDYPTFGVPYYRFKIRALKYSQQHILLLDLEKQGNFVLYAAPRFHKPAELSDAFVKKEVVSRSAFICPREIGELPDRDEHTLSFSRKSKFGIFRSEPKTLKLSSPDEEFGMRLDERLEGPRARLPDSEFFRDTADELIGMFIERHKGSDADQARRLRQISEEREPRVYLSFVARNLFDCEVLLGTSN